MMTCSSFYIVTHRYSNVKLVAEENLLEESTLSKFALMMHTLCEVFDLHFTGTLLNFQVCKVKIDD